MAIFSWALVFKQVREALKESDWAITDGEHYQGRECISESGWSEWGGTHEEQITAVIL